MMSGPGELNHVFISYAHVDDQVVPGADLGWISYLHRVLKPRLERALGERCRIWFDQSALRGNHAVTPEIARELERSATFVAVVSRGYMVSDWCRRELEIFRKNGSSASTGRIFAIDLQGAQRHEMALLGLGDLKAYRFWYKDDTNERIRTYGDPQPDPDEKEYYRLIVDLANDIALMVRGITGTDGSNKAAGLAQGTFQTADQAGLPGSTTFRSDFKRDNGEAPARHVLIAEVTDDLEPSRQQLRRYLEQAGVPVKLSNSYGLKFEEFDQQLRDDLPNAALFVQLLSRVPFRTFPGTQQGYGLLQHDRAAAAGVRILQWREPGINLAEIQDAGHRRLLDHETVLAVSLESFKKAAVEAFEVKEQEPRTVPSFVFINAEKRDHELAKKIQQHVEGLAASALPLDAGSAEEMRCDMEENLVDCDGLLIVYGDGSAAWVHQQLRLFNKFMPRRQKPIKLLAVIEAPPDEKPEIGVKLPGMKLLNFRKGIDEPALRDLFKNMSGGFEQ